MKDLPRRAVTAVIFGTVMIGGIIWCRISFNILVFVINAGCLYEYLRLIQKFQRYKTEQAKIAFWLTMILGCGFHAIALVLSNDAFILLVAALMLPIIIILFITELAMNTETKMKNALLNCGGIIYVSLFLFCFYPLTAPPFMINTTDWFPEFAAIPLGIVLLIWTNDTFAYFTGSLLGRTKILPSISPKKSWEGFIGGSVFAILTGWILSKYFTQLNVYQWISVAIIISVTGTIGDFFESFIKRKAEVKDSGNLLPGHGGFLDRFDALIFCLPFVTLYINPF